jgi:hypothetical protein
MTLTETVQRCKKSIKLRPAQLGPVLDNQFGLNLSDEDLATLSAQPDSALRRTFG